MNLSIFRVRSEQAHGIDCCFATVRTFAGTGVILSHFLRPASPEMRPTVKLKVRKEHQKEERAEDTRADF